MLAALRIPGVCPTHLESGDNKIAVFIMNENPKKTQTKIL